MVQFEAPRELEPKVAKTTVAVQGGGAFLHNKQQQQQQTVHSLRIPFSILGDIVSSPAVSYSNNANVKDKVGPWCAVAVESQQDQVSY